MRSVAFFPKDKDLRVIESPSPLLESRSGVLIHMVEVGLCGTDREIIEADHGGAAAGKDHLVIGHESLGQVVEVGPDVRSLKPGDLVVLMVRRPCPHAHCVPCRSGRADFCSTGDYTERGIKEVSGYLADLVVDEEAYVVPVPAELRDVGVLTEPLSIAEKAIDMVERIQQRLPWGLSGVNVAGRPYRHNALVLGAGPVGLLGAMALAVRGYRLYVYSREPDDGPQAHLARAIGGVYLSSEDLTPGELARRIGNIDLVYEATGAAQVSFDVLLHLGINGIFVFTGVPGHRGPFQCQANQTMRNLVLKNQVVVGTVNAPRSAYEAAVADLVQFRQRWPETLRSLITSRHPLREVPQVLREHKGGIKTVVTVAG